MNDTVELLQGCHNGAITAINSLEQVMGEVQSSQLKSELEQTLKTHKTIGEEIDVRLHEHHITGKEPGAMARMGVWMTTEMRLMGDDSDRDKRIAKLVINGCNTGVQTLNGDIHRLTDASKESVQLADSLVHEEQHLMESLQQYL